jgi:2-aminoethylphosphonate transport system permease protein
VLVWSRAGRGLVWSITGLIVTLLYVMPFGLILLASFTRQWNGVLPDGLTTRHFAAALTGDVAGQLWTSLATAFVASLLAALLGTWAALALRTMEPLPRRLLDLVFFMPSAVPSVSVGLGLLVAFSQPPLLLNGTVAIVILAHLVLISAFTYGSVAAGLSRLAPEFETMAASLGARPAYVLRRVTLPLLMPYLIAAFGLSLALSMGELGATIMVYPPGWVTLPVGIFALTDRGELFLASALTVILILVTLALLLGLGAIPLRAARR